MPKKPSEPFYDNEESADLFLKSIEIDNEVKRLEAVALGKETRAKELLGSAKEDRSKIKDLKLNVYLLRDNGKEVSASSHSKKKKKASSSEQAVPC